MARIKFFNKETNRWEYADKSPKSGENLPVVTSDDAGKFLRVNSEGAWVAEPVPSAETAEF